MENPGVTCDKCNKTIEGYRYKCLECDKFDLCQSCELDYHLGHVIMRFTDRITQTDNEFLKKIADRRPRDKPFLIQGFHDNVKCHGCGVVYIDGFLYKCCDCTYNACRRCEKKVHRCVSEMQSMFLTGSLVHEGTNCNVCENDVVGLRFKCIDCQEYDLCSCCEPKNMHVGHLLVRVGRLLDSEVKTTFEQIVRVRLSSNKRSSARVRNSNSNFWTPYATCDNCENAIHGYRYKCLQCINFDLCSFCQMKECHTEHLMVRFTESLAQNPLSDRFLEAIRKARIMTDSSIPMQENVRGRNGDYDIANKRFISIINQNKFGKTIQNCTICSAMPSEIILLNCGHLCVCSNCIDGYMRLSRQCPVCRLTGRF